MLRSVGWVPPYRCPSRRLLRSRGEGPGLITRSKIAPIPGPGLRRWLESDVFAPGGQLPIPFAQTDLRLPADRLDLGWERLQAQLQGAADLGRRPIGPRPFHQRAPGVAVAGLRDAALAAPLPRRVLRGGQPEIAHQLPRVLEPREVPQLGQQDDGAGELHAPQRLDRLDLRVQPPALHRLVQLALQALPPLLLLADR